ncbi:hypothetical protein CHS0354_038155, partial [Potamilus streckersoni]
MLNVKNYIIVKRKGSDGSLNSWESRETSRQGVEFQTHTGDVSIHRDAERKR